MNLFEAVKNKRIRMCNCYFSFAHLIQSGGETRFLTKAEALHYIRTYCWSGTLVKVYRRTGDRSEEGVIKGRFVNGKRVRGGK